MSKSTQIEKLVRLAAKNNCIAQREIFNIFHKELLGLGFRMLGRLDLAEDILQEAFIKAFLRIKKLKDPGKFEGWIKRIVINECIDHIKSVQFFESLEIEYFKIEDNDEPDWFKTIGFEEINIEIDNLPNGCRQIFVLYLIEGCKQKEIAKMLEISISTVKSQYQYALSILRKRLKLRLL